MLGTLTTKGQGVVVQTELVTLSPPEQPIETAIRVRLFVVVGGQCVDGEECHWYCGLEATPENVVGVKAFGRTLTEKLAQVIKAIAQ